MKVSTLLLPIMATTSLAAVAVFVDEMNGGTVNLRFVAAYWTGPPTDDWSDTEGFDSCGFEGDSSSCEVGGYKITINSDDRAGCNDHPDISSATIENSSGDKIEEVNGDDRCSEVEYCNSGPGGGLGRNGFQCDF